MNQSRLDGNSRTSNANFIKSITLWMIYVFFISSQIVKGLKSEYEKKII